MKFKELFVLCLIITSLWIALWNDTWTNQNTSFSKIENVNIDLVKQEWIKRNNQERSIYWLSWYVLDNNLNKSAKTRSDKLIKLWKSTHQRTNKDWYYNYWNIKSRFENLWINFEDISWTLFTESIWRWYYKCNKKDCTQDLIKSIKSTFKFFMSEKGKSRQPHYNWIVMENFSNMWVWISIDKKTNRYFLVSHYWVNTINTK